jgi:ADP-ribosylglycohydrolase
VIGAIAGDIIGSIYEFDPRKTKDFVLFSDASTFTDDTVLTVALADTILNDGDYATAMKSWFQRYPDAGYGNRFYDWALSDSLEPYNSWGNGAAMRISPVGFAYDTLEKVLEKARAFTAVTHNHPEGIKGAQATASAIFLARTGASKQEIRSYIEKTFGYNVSRNMLTIRPFYRFNESCQETVPQAIISFLDSEDYEDTIRNAISLGGDSDTLACIAGGIAEAFYGRIPKSIEGAALTHLDSDMRKTVAVFREKYIHE